MNALNIIGMLFEQAAPVIQPIEYSTIIKILNMISDVILVLFSACYFYQYVYIFIAWFGKRKVPHSENKNRFAVLVCARNEEAVIGNCIESILSQKYPSDKIKVFVCADNCTDGTAQAARDAGAIVYERFNKTEVGKGYALEYLFSKIGEDHPDCCDAFLIFDADNIVDSMFCEHMNDTYEAGYNVSTCYRNTKNYTDSIISACSGLWFLRESRYLNRPRFNIHRGCAVSGTGFMISRRYLEKIGGWKYHILIEDIQFTVECALSGEKIGYCKDAVTYDEQPVDFKTSWNQRVRWCKGYFQLLVKYGPKLFVKAIKGSFTCFDMLMNLSPAYIMSILGQFIFIIGLFISFFTGATDYISVLQDIGKILAGGYIILFILGMITTITEWKKIHASSLWKIFICFVFPLYMATYLPITIVALFAKAQWKHIDHSSKKTQKDF